MTTYGELIDYIGNQLEGFSSDQVSFGTTLSLMQSNTLTVTLSTPTQTLPQGLIEIGSELMHVESYDSQSGVATIAPWGRGQQGTTAAAHLAGSKVSFAPRYPRHRIGQVVNQVINAVCPPLFAVKQGSFTAQTLVWDYALPTDTRNVLRVELRPYGSDAYQWTPLRSAFMRRDSGVPMLRIPADLATYEIRYTVAANPTVLTTESQEFTDSGLPESCVDLISLGAIPRLVTTAELARQQLRSVEASDRAMVVPAGSGATAARFYMQMFNDRLEAEHNRLRQEYPLTMMRTS